MNMLNEEEELVYLRWVNACLRHELRHIHAPSGRTSALDLNMSMSPRSQATAKQLVSDYGDDINAVSIRSSLPRYHELDDGSENSSSGGFSDESWKTDKTLIRNMQRWWSKNYDFASASPDRSIRENNRVSTSNGISVSHAPYVGDGMTKVSFGKKDHSSDSRNRVAASFQLTSRSVRGSDGGSPVHVERRRVVVEKWRGIKKKVEKVQLFLDGFKIKGNSNSSGAKGDGERLVMLKPKLRKVENPTKDTGIVLDVEEIQHGVHLHMDDNVDIAGMNKKPSRVPKPPPKQSGDSTNGGATTAKSSSGASVGPPRPPSMPPSAMPPPPPPPGKGVARRTGSGSNVHRAPEVVELYHSLMKREAKKETASVTAASNASDAKNNMIEEIENRSAYLIAIKDDVQTQGDFVNTLAHEVRIASFANIEDVVAFVKWLDEELSYLVDERAVLKHFDWPEKKADTLREAACQYEDVMKLEKQVKSFVDDSKLSCDAALKKMHSLFEKIERSLQTLLRSRDVATSKFRESGIPVDWMQDSGVPSKVKLLSVQLVRKYMKRVASELDAKGASKKEASREFLLLQSVRFAFRVHQFAGGFDTESMEAFEELRSRIPPSFNPKKR